MISDCILVAVDGSENSLRALRAASEVSYEREGKLVVMNAFHVPPEYDSLASQMADGSHFISRLGKQAQAKAEKLLKDALERVECPSAESKLVQGRPEKSIVEAAKELNATMVVLGNRGRGEVRSLLFGSVSHYVLHHAPCPVLVVP